MTKQIPFDWDEYEKTGRPVFTRDGRKVTQLTKFDAPNSSNRLRGVVDDAIYAWYDNGRNRSTGGPHRNDLVFHTRTETRSIWVNVYPCKEHDGVYKNETYAKRTVCPDLIKTIKFTYEVELP